MGLLVFALVLLLAVLVSELAHRSVLSTAVLFLFAGFLAGAGVTDLIEVTPDEPPVRQLAEVALFAVLFTDGMRVGIRDITSAWRLPGRALFFGMPLTLVVTALLAHTIAGLGWLESFLIGAVLSPTDPVFAAAIVGRRGVPRRLRQLLNVESGLNDGLALPVVIILLALLDEEAVHAGELALELVLGIGVGIVVPWLALRLEKTRYFSPQQDLAALLPVAIGLAVFAISSITHANLFLAAFFAGVTIETMNPTFTRAFEQFGHLISEILKLAAILVFAALISPQFLGEITLAGYLFALLTLLLARPVSIGIALLGANIGTKEWAAAAWFGPKGFASVVYGLLVARSGVASADEMFHLIAIVVTASIILHSSTDVVIAKQFSELNED
ncbi:MAG: cation:proton antiporter [Actinomycetota bacterium]